MASATSSCTSAPAWSAATSSPSLLSGSAQAKLSIANPKGKANSLQIAAGGGRVEEKSRASRLHAGVLVRASYGGGGGGRGYSSQGYSSEPRSNYGGGRSSDANKMFVGNLPWSANDMSLQELFSEYGSVTEARVVKDRETGRSRGFGFVSMSSTEEMNAAIQGLDGYDVDGRAIRVNQAESRF